LKLASLAFPAIGTGVGGLSLESCARTMKRAIDDTADKLTGLATVQFVLFDEAAFRIFKKEMA
jgi:O-acetyl-ADP-ribose deacetylase (regulator of RNase III)